MKINLKTGSRPIFGIAFAIVLALALLISCDKNGSSNNNSARLQVSMVDKPFVDASEIWVDIKEIQIKMNDDDDDEAITLSNAHPGMYNLLELTGGKDTLLADATIPSGTISQIRLVLGNNNYIITSTGERIDLTTPSAEQSGLKVQLHQTVEGGVLYRLMLDFDASRSIVKAGNSGNYILKPVLRVISFVPSGGNLQGVVTPDSVLTQIIAIKGLDTVATTFTNPFNGNWFIPDAPAGNYSLFFIPVDTAYNEVQVNSSITLGQTTTVDTVRLQK